MGVHSFDDLKVHVGHEIEVVFYRDPADPEPPLNVSLECVTCYEVLIDFDRPDRDDICFQDEGELNEIVRRRANAESQDRRHARLRQVGEGEGPVAGRGAEGAAEDSVL